MSNCQRLLGGKHKSVIVLSLGIMILISACRSKGSAESCIGTFQGTYTSTATGDGYVGGFLKEDKSVEITFRKSSIDAPAEDLYKHELVFRDVMVKETGEFQETVRDSEDSSRTYRVMGEFNFDECSASGTLVHRNSPSSTPPVLDKATWSFEEP